MIGGLSARDWEVILHTLAEISGIEEAVLFGSRAMGNYRKGSDIDIAIKGDDLEKPIARAAGYLNEESPLPYSFDLIDYASIENDALREHIDRFGVSIYPNPAQPS